MLIHDGYFVHFYTPKVFDPPSKSIILILDSSMGKYKIEYVRNALGSFLRGLKGGENFFQLVDFNKRVRVWNIEKNSSVHFPEKPIVDTNYSEEIPIEVCVWYFHCR